MGAGSGSSLMLRVWGSDCRGGGEVLWACSLWHLPGRGAPVHLSPAPPGTSGDAEHAPRWEGPGCAGRAPGRKPAGATLKERQSPPDGPPPQEAGPPGIPPPRPSPAHDHRRPHPAPGAQDEADQKHRATRQAAQDTAFKAVQDTPGSPSPTTASSQPPSRTRLSQNYPADAASLVESRR